MLRLGRLTLPDPAVMGILNVTPDSFSDGGRFTDLDSARRQVADMAAEGAAIIDIGGESTRPGARGVSVQEELDRVIPAIESARSVTDLLISIDTSKPAVMREAVAAGAAMINDVRALREEGAIEAAAETGAAICLMHMQGQPRTMQRDPDYEDVVCEVGQFLCDRVDACVTAGIEEGCIVVDPGFGFGKTPAHNIDLLANLRQLRTHGRPILFGASRKSTLGELTQRKVDERLPASVAAAVIAVVNGAQIIRAHDVQATVDGLAVARAAREASKNAGDE